VLGLVNEQGSRTGGIDHAVLLVNEAPVGSPPAFYIVSNSVGVPPADNAVLNQTYKLKDGFALYTARNEEGTWKVPSDNSNAPPATPVIKIAAKSAPKTG